MELLTNLHIDWYSSEELFMQDNYSRIHVSFCVACLSRLKLRNHFPVVSPSITFQCVGHKHGQVCSMHIMGKAHSLDSDPHNCIGVTLLELRLTSLVVTLERDHLIV